MELRVGGTYKRRNGQIVTVTEDTKHAVYPFRSSQGYLYHKSGKYALGHDLDYDLIEEIKGV